MIHSLLWASVLTQLMLVTFLLIRRASQGAFLNSRNPWLTFFFRHLESFFSDISMQSTSLRNEQCTCAVIKPSFLHRSGEIINAIEKAGKCAFIMHDCIVCLGFQITAMRLNSLDRKEVEEFYEVYRDVVTEYTGMVDELSSGPSLALEISTIPEGEHTVFAPCAFNFDYQCLFRDSASSAAQLIPKWQQLFVQELCAQSSASIASRTPSTALIWTLTEPSNQTTCSTFYELPSTTRASCFT